MKQISLRLKDDLAAKVDAAAEDVPRERWIRRAIEMRLEREPGRSPPALARASPTTKSHPNISH